MLFRCQGSVCLLCVCFAAGIACSTPQAWGEDQPTQVMPQSEWEARKEAALDAQGEWVFEDVPFIELCDLIQEKLGIDVVLDVKALEDYGIDSSTPITRSLRGISNRSFLRLMLSDLELTYTAELGALLITTTEKAKSHLITKVYPVGDLLAQDPDSADGVVDYDSLQQAIMSVIAPDAWDQVGGSGTIGGIYGSLVVSQTAEIHEVVSMFLPAYRAIIENEQAANVPQHAAVILGQKGNEVIQAALDKPLTANFEDVALQDAIAFISEAMEIPIVIDTTAFEDFGIDTATLVNAKFKEIPLRFALARMLNELVLTYTIRDEVLLITTPAVDESQLNIALYPVRDLVQIAGAPPNDPSGRYADFDSLIVVITATIGPDTWDEVGGPGSIGPLPRTPTLIVSQTQSNLEKISELLTTLREAKKLDGVGGGEFDPNALIVRAYPMNAAQYTPDEIAALVIRASEPGTWSEEAGTFVQGLGPSLVVKHNAGTHRRVQKLLFDVGCGFHKGAFGGGGASGASGSTNAPQNPPAPNPAPGGGGGFF